MRMDLAGERFQVEDGLYGRASARRSPDCRRRRPLGRTGLRFRPSEHRREEERTVRVQALPEGRQQVLDLQGGDQLLLRHPQGPDRTASREGLQLRSRAHPRPQMPSERQRRDRQRRLDRLCAPRSPHRLRLDDRGPPVAGGDCPQSRRVPCPGDHPGDRAAQGLPTSGICQDGCRRHDAEQAEIRAAKCSYATAGTTGQPGAVCRRIPAAPETVFPLRQRDGACSRASTRRSTGPRPPRPTA